MGRIRSPRRSRERGSPIGRRHSPRRRSRERSRERRRSISRDRSPARLGEERQSDRRSDLQREEDLLPQIRRRHVDNGGDLLSVRLLPDSEEESQFVRPVSMDRGDYSLHPRDDDFDRSREDSRRRDHRDDTDRHRFERGSRREQDYSSDQARYISHREDEYVPSDRRLDDYHPDGSSGSRPEDDRRSESMSSSRRVEDLRDHLIKREGESRITTKELRRRASLREEGRRGTKREHGEMESSLADTSEQDAFHWRRQKSESSLQVLDEIAASDDENVVQVSEDLFSDDGGNGAESGRKRKRQKIPAEKGKLELRFPSSSQAQPPKEKLYEETMKDVHFHLIESQVHAPQIVYDYERMKWRDVYYEGEETHGRRRVVIISDQTLQNLHVHDAFDPRIRFYCQPKRFLHELVMTAKDELAASEVPVFLVFCGGTNDVYQRDITSRYKQVIQGMSSSLSELSDLVKKHSPYSKLVLCRLPPRIAEGVHIKNGKTINGMIEAINDSNGVTGVNFTWTVFYECRFRKDFFLRGGIMPVPKIERIWYDLVLYKVIPILDEPIEEAAQQPQKREKAVPAVKDETRLPVDQKPANQKPASAGKKQKSTATSSKQSSPVKTNQKRPSSTPAKKGSVAPAKRDPSAKTDGKCSSVLADNTASAGGTKQASASDSK